MLFLYATHIYRMDLIIQKKTGVWSGISKKTLSFALSCFLFMMALIVSNAQTFQLLTGDATNKAIIIFNLFGIAFLGYGLFTFTVLIMKSLMFAQGGIASIRNKRLTTFQTYMLLSVLSMLIFSLTTVNTLGLYVALYVIAACVFIAGVYYGLQSYTLLSLAKAEGTRPAIAQTCTQLSLIAAIFSTVLILMSLVNVLCQTSEEDATGFDEYLLWATDSLFGAAIFMLLRFLASIAERGLNESQTTAPPPAQTGPDPDTPAADANPPPYYEPESTGAPILDADHRVIGYAPSAPRPLWLTTDGGGQAAIPPQDWSISLENWMRFVRACMDTATWSRLADVKGESKITMYDVNAHFIKPWTHGTGCSVAGLMERDYLSVEVMISHSWSGSVKESLSAMESLVCMYFLPKETRVFFCSMCLYQPEDGAVSGLSIAQQLAKRPFATIIQNRPRYGMFVIHTTTSEVYERLWCVHEVGDCLTAEIDIFGAFDLASWDADLIRSINTRNADCQAKDKLILTDLINARGGFDRHDHIIKNVRRQSMQDLAAANLFKQVFGLSITSIDRRITYIENFNDNSSIP